jgi:hypothetical protein
VESSQERGLLLEVAGLLGSFQFFDDPGFFP